MFQLLLLKNAHVDEKQLNIFSFIIVKNFINFHPWWTSVARISDGIGFIAHKHTLNKTFQLHQQKRKRNKTYPQNASYFSCFDANMNT